MSTTYDVREVQQTAGSVGGMFGFFRKYWRAIQERRDRHGLQASLEDLSDRELRDIGITRGEIDYLSRAALSVDPRDCHR
jgi:uncharacterized protein YjiS (DUF1127 family)